MNFLISIVFRFHEGFYEIYFFLVLLNAYKWLVCYLLDLTSRKLSQSQDQTGNIFTARNETQVFYAKTLSLVFIEVS